MPTELEVLANLVCPLAGCKGVLLRSDNNSLHCNLCHVKVVSIEDWRDKCHNSADFQNGEFNLAESKSLV